MNDAITKIKTSTEPINPISFNSVTSEFILTELTELTEILWPITKFEALFFFIIIFVEKVFVVCCFRKNNVTYIFKFC